MLDGHKTSCDATARPIDVTPDNDLYLSSLVANRTGCGVTQLPWKISASPGQTLSLSLLDFSVDYEFTDSADNCEQKLG